MQPRPSMMVTGHSVLFLLPLTIALMQLVNSEEPMLTCPHSCQCSFNFHHMQCRNIKFVGFAKYPTTLTSLSITQSEIPVLSSNSFATLPALRTISLKDCSVAKIYRNTFQNLQNIQKIDITSNSLTSVGKGVFESLRHLLHLNLRFNLISSISSTSFINDTNLQHLDLSFNKIAALEDRCFRDLANLNTLNLKGNRIEKLSAKIFIGLYELQYLDLSNNQLRTIQENTLHFLPKLKELDLTENKITTIDEKGFSGLSQLTSIRLGNNQISEIAGSAFLPLTNLKHLSLERNLKFLPKENWLKNLSLVSLSLANSPKSISEYTFSGANMYKLEFLNISYNNLNSVDVLHINKLQSLKTLDIQYNMLKTMKKECFANLPNLQSVYIGKNEWYCSCDMLAWVSQIKMFIADIHLFRCAQPAEYMMENVLNVFHRQLACNDTEDDTFPMTFSHSRVGLSAILQCSANPYHEPYVKWTAPNGDIHSYMNKSANFTQRVRVLNNGDLYINFAERDDRGIFHCRSEGIFGNESAFAVLRLNYDILTEIKSVSILMGFVAAFSFLILSMFFTCLHDKSLRHCKRDDRDKVTKMQQMRRLLVNVESYRQQHLLSLREHYNGQLNKLKDNCTVQSEKLRDNYHWQLSRVRHYKEDRIGTLRHYKDVKMDALRDYKDAKIDALRDYKHNKIDRLRDARDTYTSQVTGLKKYAYQQYDRASEHYNLQMQKLRDNCAQQLKRLAETYKWQQKHLTKILENFSIDNCRIQANYARTGSTLFDSEMAIEAIFASNLIPLPENFEDFPDSSGDVSGELSIADEEELRDHENGTEQDGSSNGFECPDIRAGIGIEIIFNDTETDEPKCTIVKHEVADTISQSNSDASDNIPKIDVETSVEVNTCKPSTSSDEHHSTRL